MRVPTAVPAMTRLPLTIIGGESGSGKSTMLRQLLTQERAGDVAVVVESVAQLGLDPGMLAKVEGPCVTLTTGAMCCAITGDLSTGLAELRHGLSDTTHLLIEAAGDASLRRLAGYGYMPGYRLDGVIMVMNAREVHSRVISVAPRQRMTADLQVADLLVLNMLDEVDGMDRIRIQGWLEEDLPRLRVIETSRGRVADSMLLGVTPEAARRDARAVPGDWDPSTYRPIGRKRQSPVVDSYEPRCRVWRLETAEPIAAQRFRTWLSQLPRTVVRGSGHVSIQEDPGHRYEFHMIGHRWHLEREQPWGHESAETNLTLVGM
jgi:G3E family GTPase